MAFRFSPAQGTPPLSPLMKLLLELGPLVIFFFANSRFGLFHATALFMGAMAISLFIHYAKVKYLPVMPLISAVVVFIFGGLTLYLQDETFIKMKPTIVNILLGSLLLIGAYFKRYFLEILLSSSLKMHHEGWKKLTIHYGLFFYFLAALNEYVWRFYSTDIWVNFKVFAVMPLSIAFFAMEVYLLRHLIILEDKNSTPQ